MVNGGNKSGYHIFSAAVGSNDYSVLVIAF